MTQDSEAALLSDARRALAERFGPLGRAVDVEPSVEGMIAFEAAPGKRRREVYSRYPFVFALEEFGVRERWLAGVVVSFIARHPTAPR